MTKSVRLIQHTCDKLPMSVTISNFDIKVKKQILRSHQNKNNATEIKRMSEF